ncbi:short-chain dehydrogenase/reductase SDR [Burkholderia sp. H160]|nr:short-chain dehydrogenase/reductase SDR [Burkholderia sp. H160]
MSPSTESAASRVWFITGVSTGIGRSLAAAALARGEYVIGTLRQAWQVVDFEQLAPGRAHGVELDVTRAGAVAAAAEYAIARHGRVDVLVNNAGYGMLGALEETGLDEARALFDTNFFGPVQVTQAILPQMRRQRSGHVVNISSTVGLCGMPGTPIYSASKFAVEGLSEALAAEVAHFGIKVSIVEPGAVNTRFATTSIAEVRRRIPDYAAVAGMDKEGLRQFFKATAADAEPVVEAILACVDDATPPLRVLAGREAVQAARAKAAQLSALSEIGARCFG